MPYPIDLIHIPIGDVCVIVGMDWLSRFGSMNDCEGQRVIVRTPSIGELVIYGEGTVIGLAFCLVAMARHYIPHGCMGYLSYVVDTHVEKHVSVSDVLVVK